MLDDVAVSSLGNQPSSEDYRQIADRLRWGKLVPFFGAGASQSCGLPSGEDLRRRIAEAAHYPEAEEKGDLASVASYFVQVNDSLALEALLRDLFNVEAQPGLIHRCIASVDTLKLVVTTNYDDLIERALEERWAQVNRETRKPWYVVDRGEPGKVYYREPSVGLTEIEEKNLGYKLVSPEAAPGGDPHFRPILFKMHGSMDRHDRDLDWYLITEEHYVDFLGQSDTGRVPSKLVKIMRESSFLFLGYSLRDWNVRVMLSKTLPRNPSRKISSWAIVKKASHAEKRIWEAHGVRILEIELDKFAQELRTYL